MTTIKASCPGCGEVELAGADVTLRVATHAPLTSYSFTCPSCQELVRKPADAHVVSLLTSGGVPTEHWAIPAEVLEEHTGPALGYDDLLDFALELSGEDLLAAWAGGTLSTR